MDRSFLIVVALVAACGGPDEVCQSAPCGVSSQMYKTCGASGSQHVRYEFGGKTCECDASACTDCASQVSNWCSGGMASNNVSPGSDGGVVLGGVCVAGGGACASYKQCCSQTCAAGTCTTCGTAGASCGTTADCCPQPGLGFTCVSGRCQASCRTDGASCLAPGDCCSNVCSNGLCKTLQPVQQSCSQTLACYNACMDQTCIDGCYTRESAKGKSLDDNLFYGCPVRVCSRPQDGGAVPCTSSEVAAIAADPQATVSTACSDCMGNVDVTVSCNSEYAACMADQ